MTPEQNERLDRILSGKDPVPDQPDALDTSRLPESLRGGMERWVNHGIQPGQFLSAVIANDLAETFRRADDTNLLRLQSIVSWFYNYMPELAWGSPSRAKIWAQGHGRRFEWK